MKAGNHRVQERLGLNAVDVERVPRLVGKQGQEGQLGAAVAFAEGVDGIQLGQKMRGLCREVRRGEPCQVPVAPQPDE